MTSGLIFFGIVLLIGLAAFWLLLKTKKKKAQKPDTIPNDPAESILQRFDDL
ncbi:MAG TPA: hypothetical protein VEB63_10950 [Chitinophagaceae bacterium]|nr:hypothetical protein [Chitinophagaceae bacterium]